MTKKQNTFCRTPEGDMGTDSFIGSFLLLGLALVVVGCMITFGFDATAGYDAFILHLQRAPFSFTAEALVRGLLFIAFGLTFINLAVAGIRRKRSQILPAETTKVGPQ